MGSEAWTFRRLVQSGLDEQRAARRGHPRGTPSAVVYEVSLNFAGDPGEDVAFHLARGTLAALPPDPHSIHCILLNALPEFLTFCRNDVLKLHRNTLTSCSHSMIGQKHLEIRQPLSAAEFDY